MKSIIEVIDSNQTVVICGSTGCGKTTQVPQFILDALTLRRQGGRCNIICTQPQRISAIDVATRVAAERLEAVGGSSGFQIMMESKRSRTTKLLFCTTGTLLHFLEKDPLLRETSHVVVDEVDERSLETDFLLMQVLRDLVKSRPVPLHGGRSTGVAPRGTLHGGVADIFYTDMRSILMVLLAF